MSDGLESPAAMPGASVRAFVAFELDAAAHERAVQLMGRLRAHPDAPPASWVPPASLHITLRYLGPSGPRQLAAVGQILRDTFASWPAPSLRLEGLGGFRDLSAAHVLFATVDEAAGSILRGFHTIEAALPPLGYEPEARPYHPHLTLARLRRPADLRRWVASLTDASLGEARAVAVTLFRSDPGAVYTPLLRVPLG